MTDEIFNEPYFIEKDNSEKEKYDKIRMILGECYDDIVNVLKDYCDLKEDYYKLIATWILGTYFYREFLTYPFLFFNAMRGSGKSRLLRLIASLSWNGSLITSPTEAVLFRSAGQGTLAIDEFESIAKRENQGLREILNASYKKGMTIKRMRKKKCVDGETQVIEEFEPYCPIVMANIWGMEEVLGDRCITLILEKSSNPLFSKKAEDFEHNVVVKDIKSRLLTLQKDNLVQLCSYFSENNLYTEWNNWLNDRYNYTTTLTTLTTHTTQTTLIINSKLDTFFNEIDLSEINGRNLELFLPLFIISKFFYNDLFLEIIKIGKELTKERRIDEMTESKDVLVYEFVANLDEGWSYNVKELTEKFKQFVDYTREDEYKDWLNPKWFGRALKRLELIKEKRRMARGIEVELFIAKAQEKIKMFK